MSIKLLLFNHRGKYDVDTNLLIDVYDKKLTRAYTSFYRAYTSCDDTRQLKTTKLVSAWTTFDSFIYTKKLMAHQPSCNAKTSSKLPAL